MGKVNNALKMLAILRSREKVTRKELAEELEVTIREISRYKDDLESAGVTINEIRGRYGGYVLNNNDYLLNLNLSKNEKLALENAVSILCNQKGCFYEDLCNAVNKINAADSIKENVNNSIMYSKGIKIKSNYETEIEIWLKIDEAVVTRKKIRINYINANREESLRIVQPYALFTYYGADYFIGKCEVKNELRQFKLIRIKDIEIIDDKFDMADFNLNDYLANTIGISKGKEYNLVMKVYYPYAQAFKEYEWVKGEIIIEYPNDGYLIYKAVISGEAEIISWIMGMGRSCEVLEPVDLRNKVIEEYKDIIQMYK
ncbi:MAG: transcriptional regulator [Romboutsia sp.]|nr:transcriptional regulator [Romboutsia sp.]